MKPFFPWAEPWQVPALQPSRDSTGATSCDEVDVGPACSGPARSPAPSAVLPASRTVSVPLPSALGRISPDRETSAIAAESDGSTIRVTSSVSPVASLPVTRSWA